MDKYNLQQSEEKQETNLFAEDIKPFKPWYKRWWLYAYLVIFMTSLAVFAIFGNATDQVLDNFSVENISDSVSSAIVKGSFTQVPNNLTNDVNIDSEIVAQRLQLLNAPYIGNPDAPIVIVEFSDFECPFCRQAFPILKQMIAKNSDYVKFVYLDFPISSIHDMAIPAAHAARCANEQGKFWQYHDNLFQNQDNLSQSTFLALAELNGLDKNDFVVCMDSQKYIQDIQNQFQLGLELGVMGTPTFFVNGRRFSGVLPPDIWDQIINVLLYGVEN